jgi:hypothetical protein
MIEVLRTNDPIRLDYAVVLLKEAGCYPFVADRFMAGTEGGILAVQRRVLVPDEHAAKAKQVLAQLEEKLVIAPEDIPETDDSEGAG